MMNVTKAHLVRIKCPEKLNLSLHLDSDGHWLEIQILILWYKQKDKLSPDLSNMYIVDID